MPGAHVGDFVCHHAGKFCFIVSSQNQAGIDVEESAGEGEGIHLIVVNDLHDERNFAIRMLDQQLCLAVHIFSDLRVGQQPRALFHLGRQLPAQRNLFLD